MPFTKIFAALRHDEFIEGVPKFMNHRETYSNILLIKAAIIISQKKFLTLKKIREYSNAGRSVCCYNYNKNIDYSKGGYFDIEWLISGFSRIIQYSENTGILSI